MNMMVDPNLAASAYSNSSKITGGGGISSANEGVSFVDYLQDKAEDALDTMHASEVMSAKAITGEADVTKVVEAVSAAEVTLNTVMALRDRMITAYQEIMRMPI